MKYAERRKELLDKIQENLKAARVADGRGAPAYDHAMAEIEVAIGLLNNLGDQEIAEAHRELTLKTEKPSLIDSILLEPEQEELLCTFVDAERQVPKNLRGKFITHQGTTPALFMHTETGIQFRGSLTDAEILAGKGLLGLSYGSRGSPLFYVKPEGIRYYKELKQTAQPAVAVEKEVRGHLSSDAFQNTYPAVFKKWAEAEALLWESDSETQFTTIGHLCREALQEFADVLIRKYSPPQC